nr:hypothetical protein CFP56_24788 [Quercus suber]
MIKVPGFFASKKSGGLSTSSVPAKKPPVVVVRSGKPSPVVIRPDKESFEVPNSENIIPDFQEVNPLNSWAPADEGIMEKVTLNHNGSEEKKLPAENFEEIIEGIDKEIKKFDSTTSEKPEFGAKPGKENCMDSLCINESCEPSPKACPPQFSSFLRVPLSEIPGPPGPINNHVHAEGTWKRLSRVGMGSDVVMSNVVGVKRNARK